MAIITIHCPHCGSPDVVKNGHAPNGKQIYRCRACGRQSRENSTPRVTLETQSKETSGVPPTSVPQKAPIYEAVLQDSPIRQGEIITELTQFILSINNTEETELIAVEHSYVVVVSQDCDLDWDYRARNGTTSHGKLLPNILFCEAVTAEDLRGNEDINAGVWGNIKINKNERYQFLQRVKPEEDAFNEGLPELGVDFKRYFTLPTEEVYFRINHTGVRRRCRLSSPYAEHFCSRFYHFQSRIALPEEHFSEPSTARS